MRPLRNQQVVSGDDGGVRDTLAIRVAVAQIDSQPLALLRSTAHFFLSCVLLTFFPDTNSTGV
jgi:hypothetical protein